MTSFDVSTASPRNSLLFNMSPTSAIIFIKCRNRHHMKNNIRYKGDINNTSVIIFLIGGQKLPAMVLAWENLQWGFCDVGCCCCSSFILFFIFVVVVVVLYFNASYVMLFFSLLFNIIPHPSVDYRRVFTTILYFQPSPSRSDSRHFHFQPFRDLLSQFYCKRYGFEWVFFTHRHFLLDAPSLTFYLRLSRPPWEPAVLPWSLQGFILILETLIQPICLFNSQ